MIRILVVDDEPSLLTVLSALLKAQQFEVVTARNGEEALKVLEAENANFDLLLSDVRMSPMDGVELLKRAHEKWPSLVAIMLTAYTSVDTAVAALKLGAYDYLPKPFKIDELITTIQRALEYKESLSAKVNEILPVAKYQLENIVAESEAMKVVCSMIKHISPTETPVLVEGETGSGKETIARTIHAYSRRKNGPFLSLNCATLPGPILEAGIYGQANDPLTNAPDPKPGLLEKANGGTLFLKEIDAVPMSVQEKLLSYLKDKTLVRTGDKQKRNTDVRLIASTNVDLAELVSDGKFLSDLHTRVAVLSIKIPPLLERKEDILPLVAHFLLEYKTEGKEFPVVDGEVLNILESYNWPGNVQELGNVVKHAMMSLQDNKITKASLPSRIANVPLSLAVRTADKTRADAYKGKALKAFLNAKGAEFLGRVKRK
ncbi:MAG: sigma-54-dependent Fis family transcriptional regulator [Lentisphaerae bacterium]|nr:sigma-54-dependent Fis family transcriptional regulator [Lentisphaerota bacterium]